MSSNPFLKSFRILLLPFALIYWLVVGIRNWLYNKKIIRSTSFGLPLICVGNLAVGGTGKSPMVEYLVESLKPRFRVATLSRGYKRKTKGYALANPGSTALEIGDEPMQFYLKFPDVPVAVGERRLEAIPELLHDKPETEVIILDDAFQHRAIKAGLNILLTDYSNLFTRDFYLPSGDLRDQKCSYKRAEIIIVTKCNPNLTVEERQKISNEIRPLQNQSLFFTTIEYGNAYHIYDRHPLNGTAAQGVLLVSGIANPGSLKKLFKEQNKAYYLMRYPDHHIFNIDDLKNIRKKFATLESEKKIIITTEKDAVRLSKFDKELANMPLYVLPVRHRFLFNDSERFDQLVSNFIKNFKPGIK